MVRRSPILKKVDAMTDEKLERLIAADDDERGIRPDWTRAKLVLPQPKQSIHLRLEQDIIEAPRIKLRGIFPAR
jgi:hypothetical protein